MKHVIKINRFDAGLNTKISPLQGELNESPDLFNVEFDDFGAVSTRNGYISVNSNTAAGNFDLLHSYRSNSGAELVAVYSTVYELSGTALASVSGSTDMFSAGVRVHAENCRNYAFFSNKTAKYKYNGTDFTLWGVATPSTAVVTSIASGNSTLAGSAGVVDYAYRMALINSTNVESEASAIKTFTITNTCSPVNISFDAIPASHGVNYVSVYRDDYLLDTVTAGVNVMDNHATLTEARDTAIVSRVPPAIDVFLYHDGYMFGAETESTNLYYSEINAPEAWDPSDYIRVGDGDGFTIRALAIYNNGLIIAKEDGYGCGKVFVLYMPDTDPDNWSLNELDLAFGSISPRAICRFSTFLMLLNKNGIFDISQAQMGVMDSTALSWKVEPDVQDFVSAYLKNSVAVMYKNKIWISLPCSSGTTNNRIYQYDFVRGKDQVGIGAGAWSRFSGMSMKDICVHAGILYGAGYDGHIYQLDYEKNDDGSAIDSYFKTMHIHGLEEHHDNTKVWRYALATLDTSGDWDVTVSWNTDYQEEAIGSYAMSVDNDATLWGNLIWGISLWGSTLKRKLFKIPINQVSKSIQLKFSTNTADQHFKLYDLSLHYSLRGVR